MVRNGNFLFPYMIIYQFSLVFASIAATQNNTDIRVRGRNPWRVSPGSVDCDAGRPKKYLGGPDLVMSQETASVVTVARRRRRGNVPGV